MAWWYQQTTIRWPPFGWNSSMKSTATSWYHHVIFWTNFHYSWPHGAKNKPVIQRNDRVKKVCLQPEHSPLLESYSQPPSRTDALSHRLFSLLNLEQRFQSRPEHLNNKLLNLNYTTLSVNKRMGHPSRLQRGGATPPDHDLPWLATSEKFCWAKNRLWCKKVSRMHFWSPKIAFWPQKGLRMVYMVHFRDLAQPKIFFAIFEFGAMQEFCAKSSR